MQRKESRYRGKCERLTAAIRYSDCVALVSSQPAALSGLLQPPRVHLCPRNAVPVEGYREFPTPFLLGRNADTGVGKA